MKFGVREIVDVVFKATENGQKVGSLTFNKYQPVFMIDTATTSSLEQATTTVYAQGGKGYARLIAWEGEKTMTFTVTDALMSPMGLAVLTGAGLIKPSDTKAKEMHVHCTVNASVKRSGEGSQADPYVYTAEVDLDDLKNETGLHTAAEFKVCASSEVPAYATLLDGSGAGIGWYSNVVVTADTGKTYCSVHGADYPASGDAATKAVFTITPQTGEPTPNGTVQLDFYLVMNNDAAVQEVDIEPGSFGGYFYVEAQTLFRREDSGQDMAAEIIIPKAKIQSAFTFTMAASGDPSTFDFVMDAMPGYVRFDTTKKLMCKIQVLGVDNTAEITSGAHDHTDLGDNATPVFQGA